MIRESTISLKNKSISLPLVIKEIGLPITASLCLIIVAIAISMGMTNAIYGLVAVIATLLITACWNAWLLLVEE